MDSLKRADAPELRTPEFVRCSNLVTERDALADQLLQELGGKILVALIQRDRTIALEIGSITIKPSRSDVQFWFNAGRKLRILDSYSSPGHFLAITDYGEIVSCRDAISDFHEPLLCLDRTSDWQADIRYLVQRAGCAAAITRVEPVRVHLHEPSNSVTAGESNMFRLDATGRLTVDQRPAAEWVANILAR